MIFRRLNVFHIAILLVLPVILALINPNWLFNLSFRHDFIIMVDDYIYTGYQMAFPQYVGWYPSDTLYFIDRVSWTLPSYVIHQLFSPLHAHLIIHFALYYMAIFAVYGILNKLANRRVALIIALLFGQYPLIMRSLGWNYPDGFAMACMAVSLLWLTYAVESERRPLYLIGAGMAFMLMFLANTFNGFYAVAMALYFLLLDKTYQKPIRLVKTGIYTLVGAGVVYGGFAVAYYQLTNQLLLTNTIQTTQQVTQDARYFLSYHFSGLPPYWHIFLATVGFMAVWSLIRRTRYLSPESRRAMQAVVALFLGTYSLIAIWGVAGFLYSHVAFYHANVVMTAFVLLGMLIYKPITDLSMAQFRLITISAFFVPMIPFALYTLSPSSFDLDVLSVWLIIGAVVCGVMAMRMHQPLRVGFAVIVFCALCGVIIGDAVSIRTYTADRFRDQTVYEESTAIAQAINARYPSLSMDTFRLWYDFSDPKLPTFHAVSSIYLWTLGRNARLNEAPPEDTFFEADNIIVLTSQHELSTLLLMAENTVQNRAIITSIGALKVGDIWLHILQVRLSMLGEETLRYYFSESQSDYILEESGWNGYEQVPQNSRPFRWTAEPTARLVLDMTDASFYPDKTYRLSFVRAGGLEDEVLNSLTLSVNGVSVPLIKADNVYVGEINGALLTAPTLELIFQTDRVSNPFDLGIQDGRKLGVAIGELKIEPSWDW
jgi:4-amino-4-deoxy-L-arabinose transferase-like glycosyltransferase